MTTPLDPAEVLSPVSPEHCDRCEKSPELCFCAEIQALPNRLEVLVLQHPQEPDRDLGTAKLATLALEKAQLRIGLSWPNLKKALGRDTENRKWGVLYLGSGISGETKGAGRASDSQAKAPGRSYITAVTRAGAPLEALESTKALQGLEGIVLLDGTWSQAKALWWRNAWLLKLQRLILTPSGPSLYGSLRKEPRRECLSTLETIAESFRALDDSPEIPDALTRVFRKLLQKERDRRKTAPPAKKRSGPMRPRRPAR